jgi:hypothetical protein
MGDLDASSLYRYRIEDIDVNCDVQGDIATVRGFYTEDFQHHGADLERVRVRYSMVLQRDADHWQIVWNHRDIQEFTDEGVYVKKPNRTLPTDDRRSGRVRPRTRHRTAFESHDHRTGTA